jgi:DNA invertase Pin-like site-specific DNA recombinase
MINDTEKGPICHIYARVSTSSQDEENQLQGCRAYAATLNPASLHICREMASSRIAWKERALGDLIEGAAPGEVLIVSEVSRLARNTLECLEIFRAAAEKGLRIYAVKNSLSMDGSMSARIVSTVLAMAAEIERDFIRARTTEALERRRAQGLPLGRPAGATSASKLERHAGKIEELTRAGVSDAAICRVIGCARGTLRSYREKQEGKTCQ